MKKENKQKITRSVWIRPEQLESLRKISADTRVPQAVLIREGIDFVITKYQQSRSKKIKGLFQ